MIPQHLIMEGLYSYRSRVEIDFTRLTAARLFGIFGPVGSGKSTILEAIGLAVYGDTTRLNSRGDNRNYNVLNLRSDRLWIDFRFLNHDGHTYRFTAEARRNGNAFETVGPLQRSAYRLDGDSWAPLPSIAGEEVVGLSYDNFRRTVIIPQGRFQEFLQLGVRDRTDMLKELFVLDRFDLYRSTRNLANTNQESLTAVEAALGEIPANVTERIATAEQALKDAQAEREKVVARLRTAREWRDRLMAVVEVENERTALEAEQQRLEEEAVSIEARRKRLLLLETVRDHLAAPYRELTRASEALEEAKRRQEEAQQRLVPLGEARQAADERYLLAEKQAQERENLEARKDELQRAMAYRTAQEEFEKNQARLAADLQETEEIQKRLRAYNQQEQELQTFIGRTRKEIPDGETLRRAEEYRRTRDDATGAKTEFTSHIAVLREIVQRAENAGLVVGEATEVTSFREAEVLTRSIREAIAQERRRRDVADHLAILADQLVEGEACPLCGSVHHPAPATSTAPDSYEDFEHSTTQTVLDEIEGDLHRTLARLESAHARIVELTDRLSVLSGNEDSVKTAQAATIPETADRIGEYWQKRNTLEEKQAALQQLLTERTAVQNEGSASAERTATAKGRLEEAAQRLGAERERLPEDLLSVPLEKLKKELTDTVQTITAIAQEFEEARTTREALSRDEDKARVTVAERTEARERAEVERVTAVKMLEETLLTYPDIDVTSLPELVQDIGEIPQIRQDVTRHDSAWSDLQRRQTSLTEKAHHITPPDLTEDINTALNRAHGAVAEGEGELQTIDTRIGSLSHETEVLGAQKQRHDDLTRQQEALRHRKENLETLLRLFTGSRFVTFVASVFLEQLVATANVRFKRLTKNRLELALRGDHDFEVVDYLNGGRRRSVKTLSGGQTFQAALCLALALVDTIDHTSGSDQPGFFFLDEGFGSLDEASLRDVFATLTDLRRENRIVGVISHVESLQQEIDTFLKIHVDPERGSEIVTSYQ